MIRGFSTSITSDPVVCALSPMAQLLYFKLYMHPGNHLCGLFMYSAAHMAVDIQASLKDATDALDALVGAGFVEVDRACNLVWIPEMAARIGDITGERNKIAPAVRRYLKGVCPRKSALVDRVSNTLFNTISHTPSDSQADTPADGGSDRSLSGSVSGSGTESGSGRKKDPHPPASANEQKAEREHLAARKPSPFRLLPNGVMEFETAEAMLAAKSRLKL